MTAVWCKEAASQVLGTSTEPFLLYSIFSFKSLHTYSTVAPAVGLLMTPSLHLVAVCVSDALSPALWCLMLPHYAAGRALP